MLDNFRAVYGVIFISIIVLTETLDLECAFELFYDDYKCSPVNYAFDGTNQMIKNVIGDHEIDKTNNEVNVFSLSEENIKVLPSGLNKQFPNLEVVSVVSCSLDAISEYTFQGLLKLRKIDLFINNIKILPQRAFDDLHDLEDLQLGQNQIEHLKPDIFDKLASLKIISLNSNRVTFLEHTLFENNVDVENIFFDNNKIQCLDVSLFEKLIKLKTVSLSNNNIQFLNPNLFEHNNKLEVIDFSGNRIIKLHRNLFYNNRYLKMINFDENRIKFIGRELLDHLQFGSDNLKQARFARNNCLNVFYELIKTTTYREKSVSNLTLLSQIHHNCTHVIEEDDKEPNCRSTHNHIVIIVLSVVILITIFLSGLICWCLLFKKHNQKYSAKKELEDIGK